MRNDIWQEGFSLIELMVAIAISGMLMAAVVMTYIGQSRGNNTVQDQSMLQQDLRSALYIMAREIRMAGYNPAGTTGATSPQILAATATNLRFSSDLNGDGDTDDANEIVRYALSGSGLGRVTGAGVVLQPVADNITQLAYEYLLDDGTWTQAPADLGLIRAVRIAMLGRSTKETSRSSDTSNFIPPLSSVALDWTPAAPGGNHWRMMSLIVQCRNLLN